MFGNLYGNCSLPHRDGGGRVFYTLYGILDDVDKYLLEEDGVKMNGNGFVGQMEVYLDVGLRTQILEEGTAGIHLFTEVAQLQ